MDIVELRDYCLSKTGVTESFPFGENTLVFKVMGKMFAATNVEDYISVNLKCDPEWAETLRSSNALIKPGYHMNKKHWNTVESSMFPDTTLLIKMIDHSYDLVVSKLTKAQKISIKKGPPVGGP
jgi:predicted DNA-binding protein (MmcQ/YjbR family)